jgi:hypothetical protein
MPLAINLLLDDPCFLPTAYCLLLYAICHLLYALVAYLSPIPPNSANIEDCPGVLTAGSSLIDTVSFVPYLLRHLF